MSEVPKSNLYVGGLDETVNDSVLRKWFGPFGSVKSVMVSVDVKTARSKGFGFVEYDSPEDASKGRAALDGKEMTHAGHKSTLKVEFSDFPGVMEGEAIFVRNIPCGVPDEEITSFFSRFGTLTEPVKLSPIREAPDLLMACVRYGTVAEARRAKENTHCQAHFVQWGKTSTPINIICRFAETQVEKERKKTKKDRSGGPGGQNTSASSAVHVAETANANATTANNRDFGALLTPPPLSSSSISPVVPLQKQQQQHHPQLSLPQLGLSQPQSSHHHPADIHPAARHLLPLLSTPPNATQFLRFSGVVAVTTDNTLVPVEADKLEPLPISYRPGSNGVSAMTAGMESNGSPQVSFADPSVPLAGPSAPAYVFTSQVHNAPPLHSATTLTVGVQRRALSANANSSGDGVGGETWGEFGGGSWIGGASRTAQQTAGGQNSSPSGGGHLPRTDSNVTRNHNAGAIGEEPLEV